MTIEKQPSCEDPSDPDLLPVAEALARIEGVLPSLLDDVNQHEVLALQRCLGRVLAEDITSPIDVPSYTNSAMDGYAVAGANLPSSGEKDYQVIGTAWAGRPFNGGTSESEAVRIMTGAMMPDGTDTVVIQEHVAVVSETQVLIGSDTVAGKNVRQAGEDVQAGQVVLHKGEWLGPAQLGQLASLGVDRVAVTRQLKVAYFTTGDELKSLDQHAGKTLGPGELFDSNRYTLFGMLSRLGVEIQDLGIVRDNPEDTREAFKKAAASADVVITSGGVSAGEADYVTRIIHEIGDVAFWKLAMRPGRPLAFGKIGDAVFFGLPGNPVAVMVTFYEFVQPALRSMMGASLVQATTLTAQCQSPLRKSPGRTEYQRGIMEIDSSGQVIVNTTGKQGAGRLSSMCVANCMIVLPPGQDSIEPGEMVEVQPFFGLV